MAALLSKAAKDLTVTVLLDALQQTKDFELSMVKKFGASVNPTSSHVKVGVSKPLLVTGHSPGDITNADTTLTINQLIFRATHGCICPTSGQVSLPWSF
jgi:hypothetical protein